LLTRAAEGDGSGVEPGGDARRRLDVEHDERAVRAEAEVVGRRPLSSSPLVLTPACICVGGGGGAATATWTGSLNSVRIRGMVKLEEPVGPRMRNSAATMRITTTTRGAASLAEQRWPCCRRPARRSDVTLPPCFSIIARDG
jgi:hypothetical protein